MKLTEIAWIVSNASFWHQWSSTCSFCYQSWL